MVNSKICDFCTVVTLRISVKNRTQVHKDKPLISVHSDFLSISTLDNHKFYEKKLK